MGSLKIQSPPGVLPRLRWAVLSYVAITVELEASHGDSDRAAAEPSLRAGLLCLVEGAGRSPARRALCRPRPGASDRRDRGLGREPLSLGALAHPHDHRAPPEAPAFPLARPARRLGRDGHDAKERS